MDGWKGTVGTGLSHLWLTVPSKRDCHNGTIWNGTVAVRVESLERDGVETSLKGDCRNEPLRQNRLGR